MNTDKDVKDSNLIASGYKEPLWSGICQKDEYSLDVLKDGVFIDNIKLGANPYYIIGRFKTCDLVFEHPSLSRFHAVVQYCAEENSENREKGWYLMDLGSTHGSIINKNKIAPLTFQRIRSGYVLKFGGSSRLYIVNGPDDDKDPLSKHSWTELNEMKQKAKLMQSLPVEDENAKGCMWGMDNDSEDDASCFNNPATVQKYPHEKLYKDDPKKVIKWYFDREGVEEGPLYNFTNNGFNKSTCTLELPVFGENGHRVIAEISGSEKKKEMVERCALQACYLLDEIDELYKEGGSSIVPRKDLNYYKDKDYYSSEEDEFFDRTGDLEQKRLQRMRRFGVIDDKRDIVAKKLEAKDVDSALVKLQRLEEINNEILSIEEKLEEAKRAIDTDTAASEIDEIEKYLEAIQSGTLNRQGRLKLKAKRFELQREENLLRRQLKLTIPVTELMRRTLFSDPRTSTEKINSPKTTATMDQEISEEHKSIESFSTIEKIDLTVESTSAKKSVTDEGEEISTTAIRTNEIMVTEECERVLDQDVIETMEGDSDRGTGDGDWPQVIANMVKKRSVPVTKVCESETERKMPKLVLEEDVSDWLPPQDQTGDGRTSLNDRLGY